MMKNALFIILLFISGLALGQQPANSVEVDNLYQIEKVFPNPAETYVYVELQSDLDSDATFSLIDILGTVVQRWNDVKITSGEQKIRLTFKNHHSGIYLLRIEMEHKSEVVRIRIL